MSLTDQEQLDQEIDTIRSQLKEKVNQLYEAQGECMTRTQE